MVAIRKFVFGCSQNAFAFILLLLMAMFQLSCRSMTAKLLQGDSREGNLGKIPFHYKVIQADQQRNSQENKKGNYMYASHIVMTDNNVLHQFYCGGQRGTGYGGDKILYIKSTDGGFSWTSPKPLHYSLYRVDLSNVQDVEYHWQSCDPAVFYHPRDHKWYLYYSGSYVRQDTNGRYTKPYKTVVFIARSLTNAIDGEYETFTETNGWSTNKKLRPKPIIEPFEKSTFYQPPSYCQKQNLPREQCKANQYGAGQTSIFFDGERVHIWYKDSTDDPRYPELNGKSKIYKTLSEKFAPEKIVAAPPTFTGVLGTSVEVKYDLQRHRFVMFYIEPEHRPGAQLMKRYFNGRTKKWEEPLIAMDHVDFPDYASNVGMTSDLWGNILPGVYRNKLKGDDARKIYNLISYGAPIDPVFTASQKEEYKDPSRARWDLYMMSLDYNQDEPCKFNDDNPLVRFSGAASNSVLWTHKSLIDSNNNTVYSSQPGSANNEAPVAEDAMFSKLPSTIDGDNKVLFQVAVWSDQVHPIKSLLLHPRINRDQASGDESAIAFPEQYAIYKVAAETDEEKLIGIFKTQPVEITIDKPDATYRKILSAKIDFKEKVLAKKFVVRPLKLGKDLNGKRYFQLAEIQAELWQECP